MRHFSSWRFLASPYKEGPLRIEIFILQYCLSLGTLFFYGSEVGPVIVFYFQDSDFLWDKITFLHSIYTEVGIEAAQ